METLEATAHETYEQHQMPRNSRYSSSISREDSLRAKVTCLGLDYDMEHEADWNRSCHFSEICSPIHTSTVSLHALDCTLTAIPLASN